MSLLMRGVVAVGVAAFLSVPPAAANDVDAPSAALPVTEGAAGAAPSAKPKSKFSESFSVPMNFYSKEAFAPLLDEVSEGGGANTARRLQSGCDSGYHLCAPCNTGCCPDECTSCSCSQKSCSNCSSSVSAQTIGIIVSVVIFCCCAGCAAVMRSRQRGAAWRTEVYVTQQRPSIPTAAPQMSTTSTLATARWAAVAPPGYAGGGYSSHSDSNSAGGFTGGGGYAGSTTGGNPSSSATSPWSKLGNPSVSAAVPGTPRGITFASAAEAHAYYAEKNPPGIRR